jgi:hypothetical protein
MSAATRASDRSWSLRLSLRTAMKETNAAANDRMVTKRSKVSTAFAFYETLFI